MRSLMLLAALVCTASAPKVAHESVLAAPGESLPWLLSGESAFAPRVPAGAVLVTSSLHTVEGSLYLVAVFSNNTIASIRVAGEGGVINLPDRAVASLPGASGEEIAATWNALGVNPSMVEEPDIYAEYGPDPQGISGSAHPVEISYTYTTAAPPGTATIVVTVRGHNRNRVRRQLRNHVTAIQKDFPAQ